MRCRHHRCLLLVLAFQPLTQEPDSDVLLSPVLCYTPASPLHKPHPQASPSPRMSDLAALERCSLAPPLLPCAGGSI